MNESKDCAHLYSLCSRNELILKKVWFGFLLVLFDEYDYLTRSYGAPS